MPYKASVRLGRLFDKQFPILVAVSGGADSVALLHILVSDGYRCVAAHCNFHLRGGESDADEAFVRRFCASLNVECLVRHFDTRAYASDNALSIEMAARKLRYEWFDSILDKHDIPCVAVAHHADDAVETFFLNLLRGTGLRGLTGMKSRQKRVVRPLLAMSRQAIELYCKANGLSYRTDSSNASDDYVRNRLRHHVVPVFKSINPSFLKTMNGNMAHLACVYSLFEDQVKSFVDDCVTEFDGETLIPIDRLARLPNAEPFLYEILAPRGFSPSDVVDMARCVRQQKWGRVFFAPPLRAVVDRYNVIVQPWSESQNNGAIVIDSSCCELLSPLHLKMRTIRVHDGFQLSRSPLRMHFDAGKLTFPLTLRHWKQGDAFRPLGMKRYKKLSDFFVDAKMSRPQKDAAWVLETGGEIAALLGLRIDDRYKYSDSCKSVFEIEIVNN